MVRLGVQRVRGWLLWMAVAVTCAPAARAQDQVAPLNVEFSGPRDCGDPGRLLELSRELLGADADHAGVDVTASVSQVTERRFRLQLRLSGAVQGQRTISGTNCDEALRAGAVVVALAINPNALSAPEPSRDSPEPVPPQTTNTEASTPSVEPTPPPPKPEPPKPVVVAPPPRAPAARSELVVQDSPPSQPGDDNPERFLLGVSGRMQFGLSPESRLGGRVTAGVIWTNLVLRVQGYLDVPREHDTALAGPVRYASQGAGADLCVRSGEWMRLSLAVCGGWLVTRVTASAPDVTAPITRQALISAASAGLGLGLRLWQPVSLLAEAGVTIPTTRPRFTIDVEGSGATPVHQVEPGALVGVGLQWGI